MSGNRRHFSSHGSGPDPPLRSSDHRPPATLGGIQLSRPSRSLVPHPARSGNTPGVDNPPGPGPNSRFSVQTAGDVSQTLLKPACSSGSLAGPGALCPALPASGMDPRDPVIGGCGKQHKVPAQLARAALPPHIWNAWLALAALPRFFAWQILGKTVLPAANPTPLPRTDRTPENYGAHFSKSSSPARHHQAQRVAQF